MGCLDCEFSSFLLFPVWPLTVMPRLRLLSVSITTVATQVIKVCVGRPRPDMISRCQPIEGAADLPVYGLSTMARVCTVQTGHIIDDGFKSFPSGHSSFAFAGLLYLSLYAAGKMHLFDRRGHAVKAWIAFTPCIGATLIAVSRTSSFYLSFRRVPKVLTRYPLSLSQWITVTMRPTSSQEDSSDLSLLF